MIGNKGGSGHERTYDYHGVHGHTPTLPSLSVSLSGTDLGRTVSSRTFRHRRPTPLGSSSTSYHDFGRNMSSANPGRRTRSRFSNPLFPYSQFKRGVRYRSGTGCLTGLSEEEKVFPPRVRKGLGGHGKDVLTSEISKKEEEGRRTRVDPELYLRPPDVKIRDTVIQPMVYGS